MCSRAAGLQSSLPHCWGTRVSMKHDVSVTGKPMSDVEQKVMDYKPRGFLQVLRLRPLTPQAPFSLRQSQPSALDCV